MGRSVQISPVVVFHGDLAVEIETDFAVSQPTEFSRGGKTAVVPDTNVQVFEEEARNVVLGDGSTVEDLVRALMSIGSTPRDVISILQNIQAAGALDAELVVI